MTVSLPVAGRTASPTTTAAAPLHLAFLDALRGWAILMVVMVHVGQGRSTILMITPGFSPAVPDIVLPYWLRAITDGGGNGVTLFFVVSAFSLSLGLLGGHGAHWRGYAWRRFLRIAPMFYLAGAFYLLWTGLAPRAGAPNGIAWWTIPLTAIFMHVWSPAAVNLVVPGGWSVWVEAQFYLILPALLALTRRIRSLVWLGALATLGLVGAHLLYLVVSYLHLSSVEFRLFWPGHQLVNFPWGILAVLVLRRHGEALRARATTIAPVALDTISIGLFGFMLLVLSRAGSSHPNWGAQMLFAPCAAGLCVLLALRPARVLVNAPLAALGRVSFSLYLVHFVMLGPGLAVARALLPADAAPLVVLGTSYGLVLLFSVPIAALTFAWVETPFIALGRRLSARPA